MAIGMYMLRMETLPEAGITTSIVENKLFNLRLESFFCPETIMTYTRIATLRFLISFSSVIFLQNGAAADQMETVFLGQITKASVAKFIAEHEEKRPEKIILFSQGGDVEAGITFGEWVHDYGINVQVRTLCMSACANYVFVAGKNKTIENGALVIWHGSLEQKNVREDQEKYRSITERLLKAQNDVSPEEREFLSSSKSRYDITERLRKKQAEFYTKIGVNEYVTRLGQEPVRYPVDGWTASPHLMQQMGISNVIASQDYGSKKYLSGNKLASIMSKGTPLFFDWIDGEISLRSDTQQ